MKQVLKSTKRKYLVGGIAAFAGIALLTTGVATWVIGANSTASKDVTVTVDGKQNNLASVTIGDVTSLKVGETSNVDKGFVKVTDASSDNMKISLKNVTYSFGSSFTSETKPKVGLKLSIEYSYNSDTGAPSTSAGNLVAEGASKFDRSDIAKDGKLNEKTSSANDAWHYIEVQEQVSDIGALVSEGNKAGEEHTITTSIDVTFSWGSFFNKSAPSTFYNSESLNLSSAADAQKVEDELSAMDEALKAGIKITAELVAHA